MRWAQAAHSARSARLSTRRAAGYGSNLRQVLQEFIQAIEKDGLSLDNLGARLNHGKPGCAVDFGYTNEPAAFGRPFDFAGNALDSRGIKITFDSKRRYALASRLNHLAERVKSTRRAKAGFFFELSYRRRLCCLAVGKFALGNGPAVAFLVAPERAAWVDKQNHRLCTSQPKHEDTRAVFHEAFAFSAAQLAAANRTVALSRLGMTAGNVAAEMTGTVGRPFLYSSSCPKPF